MGLQLIYQSWMSDPIRVQVDKVAYARNNSIRTKCFGLHGLSESRNPEPIALQNPADLVAHGHGRVTRSLHAGVNHLGT